MAADKFSHCESPFVKKLLSRERLIATRRANQALAIGEYHPLAATGDVLLYRRSHSGCASVIVALNLGDQPAAALLHGLEARGRVILSTYLDSREGELIKEEIDLRPNEGLVIELSN